MDIQPNSSLIQAFLSHKTGDIVDFLLAPIVSLYENTTNGSDTLHSTETGTGTGNRMGTIENNGSLSLSRSRAVCTSHNCHNCDLDELHMF